MVIVIVTIVSLWPSVIAVIDTVTKFVLEVVIIPLDVDVDVDASGIVVVEKTIDEPVDRAVVSVQEQSVSVTNVVTNTVDSTPVIAASVNHNGQMQAKAR